MAIGSCTCHSRTCTTWLSSNANLESCGFPHRKYVVMPSFPILDLLWSYVRFLSLLHIDAVLILCSYPPSFLIHLSFILTPSLTVWWINIFERDESALGHPLVRQTPKPIRNNTDFTINSYDTHAFIAVSYTHLTLPTKRIV